MDERTFKRLRWRARRGTQELDRLLRAALDAQAAGAEGGGTSSPEVWERLLATEDDRLQSWLIHGESPTDGELNELVTRIRRHAGVPPAR